MLKAVIFDVDGTLLDSNDLHARAWQRAFRNFGYDLPLTKLHHQVGKGGDQYVPHFLTPKDNARFGRQLDRYKSKLFKREYARQVRPFPRVRDLLQRIREEGLRIAFATSAKHDELEQYRKLLHVDDLIEEQTTKDDARHSKPAPDIFAAALAKLAIEAAEAVAVGDTPYDAQACRMLGLPIIGLQCGGFSEEELLAAGCFTVYRDPAGLLENFERSPLCLKRAG